MKYHKLLAKQIQKLLTQECMENPNIGNFINAVNESYQSFDRDKELMNHAFSQSEEEYQALLKDLNKENSQKQKSISKLYASLKTLDNNLKTIDTEDLEELVEYFSAQIKKRKQVEDALNHQFEFQKLLMNIASEYISVPFDEINNTINTSLEELAEFVKADRAYIFLYDFASGTCSNTHEYCGPEILPQIDILQNVPIEAIPEWVEANVAGKSINIPDVAEIEEGNLKDILSSQDIKSLLVVPMMQKGEECIGFVGFDSVKQKHTYNSSEEELLFLFASVLGNAQERVAMERDLTRTVELLKTLLANLQHGILVEDENRKILFTNDLFCKMFKIPITPDQMEGIDCTTSAETSKNLFEDEEAFPLRISKILEDKKVITNELLKTKDGRFLERDYIPIFINDHYRGHLWKYNDITKRVLTQQLLQQSEERNRLIMNSAINAIINIDSTGRITFWNKSAETIFGWAKDEVLGRFLTETIIPKQHRKAHRDGVERYMLSGEKRALNKQMELTALRKNGEEVPVEISIIPIEQDGGIFFCSFIQDISVRKKSEENLRLQEEKYRNIIANMNLGLIEVDSNEKILYANQSFCDVSGFRLDEIIGKTPVDLFVRHEENVSLVNEQIALRREGISSQFLLPIRNKRGELRWWVVSGAPNYDDHGNLIGSIGIHLDITEQKRLEGEYKKEKEKALEASKAKEAFLANMSHEIRTPLNAIIGFLRELSKQKLTTMQRQFVENSSNASLHLLSIINNILDISKIEAGEMPLEDREFSLRETVGNVVNILKSKVEQKKIKLQSVCDPDVAPVFSGDAMKIEQILFNLIGNSLKFTTKGKIVVECQLLEDRQASQKIKIMVSDTGMNKDFIDNIFKKFYQEDESIARKFGGTGLGMAITSELVKLMDGKINIRSEKNKGTVIEIIFDIKKGIKDKGTSEKEDLAALSVEGIRVLLVEDNELNRMVAQNTLQNFRCIVAEAENGEEAIKILKKQTFDVVLMDIQMPELDGIETTKILRQEHQLKIPIIALTANAFKTEIEKCKEAGMNDYVTKPFSEEALLEILNKYSPQNFHHLQQHQEDEAEKEVLLYDLTSIRKLSRGNEDFVKKMISIFVEQVEALLPDVNQLFLIHDYDEISRRIHKIKPSVESIGVFNILDEVKFLEFKSKEEEPNHKELTELFSEIEKVLSQVVEQLKSREL